MKDFIAFIIIAGVLLTAGLSKAAGSTSIHYTQMVDRLEKRVNVEVHYSSFGLIKELNYQLPNALILKSSLHRVSSELRNIEYSKGFDCSSFVDYTIGVLKAKLYQTSKMTPGANTEATHAVFKLHSKNRETGTGHVAVLIVTKHKLYVYEATSQFMTTFERYTQKYQPIGITF